MKVALIGYGKMGREIEALLGEEDSVVLKVGRDNREAITPETLGEADVAIEFSAPESALENIRHCFAASVPVVSGTTGWLSDFETVRQECLDSGQALFYAPNFSIGVNVLFRLNATLAKWMNPLKQYDVDIEEIHHKTKLDAPSGTAIRLAEDLVARLDVKTGWSLDGADSSSDLVVRSKREDEIPGTHIIAYSSSVDTIELKHTAHSRQGFAAGALSAARWLVGKKGVFGMDDLLGWNS